MRSQQELSDRLEIGDLITALSYAIDFHRFDDLDAIFTSQVRIDGDKATARSTRATCTDARGLSGECTAPCWMLATRLMHASTLYSTRPLPDHFCSAR